MSFFRNGRFDMTTILSCVISKLRFGNIVLTRSTDKDVLETCDILFGVGEEYNVKDYKFDYSVDNFNDTFDESSSVLLTAAGIAWKYFGKSIIEMLINELRSNVNELKLNIDNTNFENRFIDEVYVSIYYTYIYEIDANNGYIPRLKENETLSILDVENYSFHLNLQNIVSNYNCSNVLNNEEQLKAFYNAMTVVDNIFLTLCKKFVIERVNFYNDYENFEKIYPSPQKLPR